MFQQEFRDQRDGILSSYFQRFFRDVYSKEFLINSLNRIREKQAKKKAIRNSRFSIRSFIRPWFIDLLEASSGFNQEQRIVRMRSNCTRSWKLVYTARGGIQVRKFVPCLSLWFVWFSRIPWKVNFIRILNLYFEFVEWERRILEWISLMLDRFLFFLMRFLSTFWEFLS